MADKRYTTKRLRRGGSRGSRFVEQHQELTKKILAAEREKPLSNEVLFPSWQAYKSDVTFVPNATYYLPAGLESLPFGFAEWNISTEQPIEKTQQLRQFEVYKNNNGDYFMFAGGPVWSIEWCPQEEHQKQAFVQYFALGVHSSFDEFHIIGQRYQSPNAIQIWCAGKLGIEETEEDVSPSLVMLIAHEYGPVWDLSWCPRGSPTNAAPANGAFPRLGLLAAVFGDGNLRIFAVPHPDSIEQPKPVTIKLKPVYEVSLGPESLMWTVEWNSLGDCDMIIAGCQDGTVAVWRISETPVEATIQSVVPYTCKPFHDPTGFHEDQEQEPEDIIEQTAERDDSDPDEVDGGNEMEVDDDSNKKELKTENELLVGRNNDRDLDKMGIDNVVLPPLKLKTYYIVPEDNIPKLHIRPHLAPVRAVRWNPDNAYQFATVSMDSTMQVWDMRDATEPIYSINLGASCYSCDWIGGEYSQIIVGTEDTLHNVNPAYHRIQRDFHPAAIWSISASKFMRYSASADADGNVYYDMLISFDMRRRPKHVELLDGVRLFSNGALGFVEEVVPYNDRPPFKVGALLFGRVTPAGGPFLQGPRKSTKQKCVVPFPDKKVAIHRIKWNPHAASCNWIIYGGHAGILRLRRVSDLGV